MLSLPACVLFVCFSLATAAPSCTIPSGKKLKAGEKFTEGNDQVGVMNYECNAKGNLLMSSVCPSCAGVKCATKCSCGMCARSRQ
uniref:Uncharacterized protein n=1 Tax=Plectus sambesii TaxID=2011161 RepID=A0A914W6U4_9BILA